MKHFPYGILSLVLLLELRSLATLIYPRKPPGNSLFMSVVVTGVVREWYPLQFLEKHFCLMPS